MAEFGGQKHAPLVRVYLDRDGGIDIDTISAANAWISEVLDAQPELADRYTLEVSSPGIDRPLTKPEHFRRFLGRKVRVKTRDAIEGQRNFKGTLADADDETVTVAGEGSLVRIPFDGVERSNLIPELDFGGES